MKQRQRIYYTEAQKALMWECWRKVDSLQHIARLFRRNLVLTPGHLMCTGAIAYEVAGFSFDHLKSFVLQVSEDTSFHDTYVYELSRAMSSFFASSIRSNSLKSDIVPRSK